MTGWDSAPLIHTTSNSGGTYIVSDYLEFNAGEVPAEYLQPQASCFAPASKCANGDVQTLQMVVAQPPYTTSKYDIANQDTADWLGDTVFTCLDVESGHTSEDQYGVVSLFEVQVDTRWGEYSQCNGYPGQCFGREHVAVGREASLGVKPNSGQCDPGHNLDVGNWYSMPDAGQCTANQTVGKDCTWRVVRRVKTVEIKCLFGKMGMLEACKADATVPFTKAVTIMKTALLGDNDICPDIPPPPAGVQQDP